MSPGDAVTGAELFSASALRIVGYLRHNTPIPEWSVNRVAGGEQVHVHAPSNDVMHSGMRVGWNESFCRRMVDGAAQIVPDALADPDYADNPHAQTVRAYAGVPLRDERGTLFGTLCGVGTEPLTNVDEVNSSLIELMAELLTAQLRLARMADRERRAAEIAAAMSLTDALTGLMNRRGWDLLVQDAERRVAAYGDPVAVAVIDLDGLKLVNDRDGHAAGDALLRRTGEALTAVAGPGDRLARYGGDEFAILSNNVAPERLDLHFAPFVEELARRGVSASLGFAATRASVVGVVDAFSEADSVMYSAKRIRRLPALDL